ncbi:MAG TPA: DUF5686 family protein, partial [Flavobacteriaceae bacterium]|nr:DUF5686 family protein [Flavobacteriaceae bacterium]
PFVEHNIAKLELGVRINFGQKYYRYPDGKYIADENNWPLVFLGYEKGFASTVDEYDYNELKFTLSGDFSLQNKGELEYSLKTGTFFNAENMAFLDYKHFNGNQTRVGTTPNYIGKFNLLPYYDLSTDQEYAEIHLEHDFQGWVLGKIPFVSKLNLNLIAGAKSIFSGGRKPYSEVSLGIDNIGIGKFRFLRLDYVRSFYGDQQEGALIFGIKFFGLLER